MSVPPPAPPAAFDTDLSAPSSRTGGGFRGGRDTYSDDGSDGDAGRRAVGEPRSSASGGNSRRDPGPPGWKQTIRPSLTYRRIVTGESPLDSTKSDNVT